MANKEKKPTGSRLVRWRWWIQAAFLLVWLDPLMLRLHTVCGPVFHCYSCPLATFACPIGVLANFGALHVLPFVALGTLIAVGALFGTLVCGWACPFGYLQDLAGKAPTPRFQLPRWTGHLRYVVLAGLVVAVPFLFGQGHPGFICRVCPAGALEAALPAAVGQAFRGEQVIWPSGLKIGITLALVGLAFFTWRPWCRMFCPLGAIYGLFNRFSGFFLRFHPDRCVECGRCHKPCQYGVAPGERANDPRCLRCLECTECGAFSFGTAFTAPQGARSRPPGGGEA